MPRALWHDGERSRVISLPGSGWDTEAAWPGGAANARAGKAVRGTGDPPFDGVGGDGVAAVHRRGPSHVGRRTTSTARPLDGIRSGWNARIGDEPLTTTIAP